MFKNIGRKTEIQARKIYEIPLELRDLEPPGRVSLRTGYFKFSKCLHNPGPPNHYRSRSHQLYVEIPPGAKKLAFMKYGGLKAGGWDYGPITWFYE